MILILARRDNYTANMLENYLRSFHELCLVSNEIDKFQVIDVTGSNGEKELTIYYRGIAVKGIINLEVYAAANNYGNAAVAAAWQPVLKSFNGRVINRITEPVLLPFMETSATGNESAYAAPLHKNGSRSSKFTNVAMTVATMYGDDEYPDYSFLQSSAYADNADDENEGIPGKTKSFLIAGADCFDLAHPEGRLNNQLKPLLQRVKTGLLKNHINFCFVTIQDDGEGYRARQVSLSPAFEQYKHLAKKVDYSLFKYLLL
ncbi:hypothetical protein BH09BAC6_BH09BAC6_13390 [soil metagenome]|jgi:hypothetical protein